MEISLTWKNNKLKATKIVSENNYLHSLNSLSENIIETKRIEKNVRLTILIKDLSF